MRWDPQQYGRFSDERNRPFFDLVARIRAESPRRVIDLGCGPGDLTARLTDRWPGAEVLGIDNSPEMIARCQFHQSDSVKFQLEDVVDWQMTTNVDVVVSNAVLQWVPGHLELIRGWAHSASPGTWLAWQVPGNFKSPSHVLMRELATSAKWAARVGHVLRHADAVSEPAEYLELLLGEGFAGDAWETTYLHILQGEDPVLNWVRGTALRPVLAALSPTDAAEFESEYARLLRDAYPAGDFGTVFPFRRIFCVGVKIG